MPVPSTNLKILSGIPWDKNFQNVRKFESASEQLSYFNSKVKYSLGDDFGFITKESDPIRVEKNQAELIGCNYLMFNNVNYLNKWFYAFITDIQYVSDSTSLIFYQVDEYQSWLFDIAFNQCFVEREHSSTDNIGDNTVPEGLELGPYIIARTVKKDVNIRYKLLAAVTPQNTTPEITVWNNLPSGLMVYDCENADSINLAIKQYTDAGTSVNNIVMIYQYPYISSTSGGSTTFSITPNLASIDGYVPKNKKLFTFPYNYINLSNGSGTSMELRYELFSGEDYQMTMVGAAIPSPECAIYPKNYATNWTTQGYNNNYILPLKNFATVAWSSDAFQAWWAQNKSNFIASTASGVASSIGTMFVNPVAGVGGLLGTVVNSVTQVSQAKDAPDCVHGLGQCDTLPAVLGTQAFFINMTCITKEYAMIIDNFFQRFGYKTNRIKTPNTSGRPYFNYVKTAESDISGNIPIKTKEILENAMNSGITFWHTNDIYNFDVDNSPT